jgi:hypothetical protein
MPRGWGADASKTQAPAVCSAAFINGDGGAEGSPSDAIALSAARSCASLQFIQQRVTERWVSDRVYGCVSPFLQCRVGMHVENGKRRDAREARYWIADTLASSQQPYDPLALLQHSPHDPTALLRHKNLPKLRCA